MNKLQKKALNARLNLLKEIKEMDLEELIETHRRIELMNFDTKGDKDTLLDAIDERRGALPQKVSLEAVSAVIKNDGVGVGDMG